MTCALAFSGCRKTSFGPSLKTVTPAAGNFATGPATGARGAGGGVGAVSSVAVASWEKPDTVAPSETGERGWAPAVAGPLGAGSPEPPGCAIRRLTVLLLCGWRTGYRV